MKITKRTNQKLFLLSLIVLLENVIIGYTVFKGNQKRINAEKLVQHSEQVIYQSANVLSLVKDVENAGRGFVITLDSTYLEPLYNAQKTIFTSLKQIKQLTRDDLTQQRRLDSLNYYILKRLDFTLKIVEIRSKKGLASAVILISTKQGKIYSDHIRQITNSIQQEEETLHKKREQLNEHSIAMLNWVVFGIFILLDVFTILLILAFRNILLHNKEKEKRAEALIIADKELVFQNQEKEKRAVELSIANKELIFQNQEKEKRAVELVIAKNKAEESEHLKSAFLANMSHEIRTPMNGILGFTELLKTPDLKEEKQIMYIRMIEKGGERMLNIINDIISISKVESGQMEISISETNINEQIKYIYTFFKPEAESKGIHLFVNNSLPDKEAFLKTDREKVYAVLTNLVKNAIKFTQTGSIEVGYLKKDKYLEIFVRDTGVGIPLDMLLTVFERFKQGSESLSRNYEGAGLGLSIAKAYVKMLGGEIWVESEEGKGSTFFFTLPYNTEAIENNIFKKVLSSEGTESKMNNLKILIAEDDEASAMLQKEIIGNYCRDILHVITGSEAVIACRSNPDIDLILMDMKMPEMDGYEATRQIRLFNTKVIIIAQTAYALISDKEKTIAVGCNEYISKPINRVLLIELIGKYFNKS